MCPAIRPECNGNQSPGKTRGSGDVDLSSSARERQQVKPHHPINILFYNEECCISFNHLAIEINEGLFDPGRWISCRYFGTLSEFDNFHEVWPLAAC